MSVPPRIRVLVVDDSIVVRHLVRDALGAENDMEVVGTCADGQAALEKITQLKPDVVVLDLEMPKLDGIEVLRQLRDRGQRTTVIVFSTITTRGASATMDALALGARDWLTKPSGSSASHTTGLLRTELAPRIRALVPIPAAGSNTRPVAGTIVTAGPGARQNGRVSALVVGVSTGGPEALTTLLQALPSSWPLPILIVQHMPALFTKVLAERLAAHAKIPVREAQANDVVAGSGVWVAPGDFHMRLQKLGAQAIVKLDQGERENGCRPAVDPLFQSAAGVWNAGLLGLILTGMGQDGLAGCRAVKSAGGEIWVQDEATSAVWGMPGTVARAGLADRILSLPALAGELQRRIAPPSIAVAR